MTLLYSSTAPTGWNQLAPETKQQFYSIASKGEWTATEAYDHLVPDTLKDNPKEVKAWMDGNEDIGVPDRDCSRIEAGGEYSADNTVMEDMSINRARGNSDMTAQELVEARTTSDIQLIENTFSEDVVAGGNYHDAASTTEGGLGLFGALSVAEYVAKKLENSSRVSRIGWTALAGGGAALLLATPVGAYAATYMAFHKGTELTLRLLKDK